MRILHLLNHTNRLNGHVHAAVDLACEQTRLGHEVCVGSGGGDFDNLLAGHGVTSYQIDHTRRIYTLLRSLLTLRAYIQRWKPDILHAHMMTSAVLAWPVCKMANIPMITTVHNEFEKSAILMGLGDRVIAVSNDVAASMNRRGVPQSRLRVVLNGTIGSARFVRTNLDKVNLNNPSILFVGGLHPRKGLTYLLEAFNQVYSEHPNTSLYIVGDGPHSNEYQELARRMDCKHAITFLGVQKNPFAWMSAADIFVLPSLADPAPLVICEAREAGCAVIGTHVGGIPQLLEYGEAGFVVPPKDAQALAGGINRLLSAPELLREWKCRSQINIGHLTINRVARETLSVYEEALQSIGSKVRTSKTDFVS